MSFGSPHFTLPDFEYVKPSSLRETLSLLDKHRGDAKILAGGVGLIPFMKERLVEPQVVVDIKSIPELCQLKYNEREGLTIGAAVPFNDVLEYGPVRSKYRALHKAISTLSDTSLRNRSTILGNLCEALPFVDSPAPLITFDAEIQVASVSGERVVPAEEFVKGMAETAMTENEMAVAVRLPEPPQNSASGFARHLGDGSEFSIVSVAALVATERSGKRKARLAYGGIATTPIRAKGAEEILASNGSSSDLIKRAVGWVSQNVTAIDDNLASADYRKHMMEVLTYRLLSKLMRGEQS